jgi:Spy/CpxP family protein refolding chaperone
MRFRSLASITVLGLALATAPALSAQNQGAPPAGGSPRGRMQAMLFEGITLTPAQQTQIDSIRAHYRSQMPAMTPGTPPSDADRQKAMQLMQASTKAVRGVLTPDQQAIYDKNMAAMQERMGGGMPSGGAPAQGAPPQGAPPKN